jgi:outer membrane protein
MKPKFLTLLLATTFSVPAVAENLSEVYRAALAYDPTFASAQATYQAARERLPQARAGLLPNASLNANARYNDVKTTIPSNSDFDSRGWGASASQPIFRGQNLVAYDQAKVAVQLAENQFKTAGQDLILRAAKAYFDVLLAKDTLEFIRAQKIAIAEQLASAKRNFEVGTATITDTHEAQARFDLATAQEIGALNDLEVKRRALHTLAGKPIDNLAPLGGSPMLASPSPQNMDDWVTRSQSDNLQVLISQQTRQIADKEIERARAGHYPTLDLTASYTDNSNQSFGANTIDNQSTVVGLELALPIFQGGLTSSRVREAVANKEKARQDVEDALRNAALQTRQAFLNVTSTEAQVKALQAALSSSEKSLESTQLGLQVGVRTNVDVLNAQQQVFSAKKDLAAARYNFLQSVLNLKAAAGSLSPQDLEEIDRLLAVTPSEPYAPAKTSLAPAFTMKYTLSLAQEMPSDNEAAAPATPPDSDLAQSLLRSDLSLLVLR